MIAGTIWTSLISTLENNPTLSKYIKYVYGGKRYDLEPESLPCLMLEPRRDGDIEKDFNTIKNVYFEVDLFAVSSNNPHSFKSAIIGDGDYKGILDINNDVRACLQSSNTLGEKVIDIIIEPADFAEGDIGKYPVRGLAMLLKILYRQTNGV